MLNENREICKRTVNEIESYCENKMYRCPLCGEAIEWDDAQYNPRTDEYACPICKESFEESELEALSLYDYFSKNIYDVEYRIDERKEYRSVEITVAGGGPNIYIDTKKQAVMLRWWNESAEYGLLPETIKEIDGYFEEEYENIK